MPPAVGPLSVSNLTVVTHPDSSTTTQIQMVCRYSAIAGRTSTEIAGLSGATLSSLTSTELDVLTTSQIAALPPVRSPV